MELANSFPTLVTELSLRGYQIFKICPRKIVSPRLSWELPILLRDAWRSEGGRCGLQEAYVGVLCPRGRARECGGNRGSWNELGYPPRTVGHQDDILTGVPDWSPFFLPSLPQEKMAGWPGVLGHRCLILGGCFLTEAAAEGHLRLLSTVAQAVKGQGTICWVDCGYVLGTWHVAGGQGAGRLWPVGAGLVPD